MNIAYTLEPRGGGIDPFLADVAQALLTSGAKVCGTVQINCEQAGDGPCDMDVKVLPDGPSIRISQSLGRGARGCRLNPDALEQAVGLVRAQLQHGAEVLIINKFGKHEADGRGFREVIAEALALDIPVIVGLNPLNKPAFEDFAGGLAQELPADLHSLIEWVDSVSGTVGDQRLAG